MTAPGALDLGLVRDAVADDELARPPGDRPAQPGGDRGRGAQPGRDGGHRGRPDESFSFTSLIAVVAISADKDVPAILDQLEPVATRWWPPQLLGPGHDPPPSWPSWPSQSSGRTGCRVAQRLDDAIELGVALADEADAGGRRSWPGCGGAGLLITGSVITAGEARLLLVGEQRGRGRSYAVKRLLATVLIIEAIVDRPGGAGRGATSITSGRVGRRGRGRIAAGAALVFAILARPLLPATLVGGSVLQVFVIVAGVIVPVMYFLGAIFAPLWVIGIWLGRRIERPAGPLIPGASGLVLAALPPCATYRRSARRGAL